MSDYSGGARSPGQSWQSRGGSGGGRSYGGGGGGSGGKFQRKPEGPPTFYRPYVMLANRDIPAKGIEAMQSLAAELEKLDFTLRIRGVGEFEKVLEEAIKNKEMHLPWKGFDEKDSPFAWTPENAKLIAAHLFSGFSDQKPVFQSFMACIVKTMMGKNLVAPAMFAVIYSADGVERFEERGPETREAADLLAVANAQRIPVFNIAKQGWKQRLFEAYAMNKPFPKMPAKDSASGNPHQEKDSQLDDVSF